MSGPVTYRARKSCIAGGAYRRPGEIFIAPEMDKVPEHLEALGEVAAAEALEQSDKARKTAGKSKGRAVTADDGAGLEAVIDGGKPVSSSEVTSADLIKE